MSLRHAALFALAVVANGPARSQGTEKLFASVSPSVVVVESLSSIGKRMSQGSGVVIAPSEVVTNCHVLDYRSRLNVVVEGRQMRARLSRGVWNGDLCVLRTEGDLPPAAKIARGPASALKVGQRVITIGSPQGMNNTVADGLVSGFRKIKGKGDLIQTSAPISAGSSGGGMFNLRGELVAITSLTLSTGQNINFAIPASLIGTLPDAPPDYALDDDEKTELSVIELIESERYEDALAVASALVARYPDKDQFKLLRALSHASEEDRAVRLVELGSEGSQTLGDTIWAAMFKDLFLARDRGSRLLRKSFDDRDMSRVAGYTRKAAQRYLSEKSMSVPVWEEYAMGRSVLVMQEAANPESYIGALQRDRLVRNPRSCYVRVALHLNKTRADLEIADDDIKLLNDCGEHGGLLSVVMLKLNRTQDVDEKLAVRVARQLAAASPSRWRLAASQVTLPSVRAAGDAIADGR